MNKYLVMIYENLVEELSDFEKTYEEKGGIAELKENYIELRIDGYLYELINYENDMRLEIFKSNKVHYEFYDSSVIYIFPVEV